MDAIWLNFWVKIPRERMRQNLIDFFKGYTWLVWLFIAGLVFGPRLLDLDVFYARDELTVWTWSDEFTQAVWAQEPAATLTESNYPGIPLFWANTAFLTLKYRLPDLFPQTLIPADRLLQEHGMPFLAERRAVTGLFVGVQLLAVVWLVWRLFGGRVAVLSAILLGLDPFSLTESRVFRLEMVSDLFVILSLLLYLLFLKERSRGDVEALENEIELDPSPALPDSGREPEPPPVAGGREARGVFSGGSRWPWLLLSGVMAGWGVSSKTSAGLLVPFIWLLLLLDLLLLARPWREKTLQMIRNGLIWAGGAVAGFWLIWPAMWVRPVEALTFIFVDGLARASTNGVWHGDVFFWGQRLPEDPGKLFYPVVLAFRTTPLTWLGLLAALGFAIAALFARRQVDPHPQPLSHGERGVALATGRGAESEGLWGRPFDLVALWLLLAYAVIIVLELTFVLSKVDRFLLLMFPVLNILTALGLVKLIDWVTHYALRTTQYATRPRIFILAATLILALQLLTTLPAHPYYYTYWNPLVGGAAAAVRTLPVGSGEGLDQVVRFVNDRPDAAQAKLICGASAPWCSHLFAGETLRFADYTGGRWLAADYASFYISQLQRGEYPQEIVDFFMAQPPLHRVDLNGATYAWLFEVPQVEHQAEPFNDLAGLGELYGYNLAPATAEGTTAAVGEAVTVTVWWGNFGAGVDSLVVRWLDQSGYEWGRAPLKPQPAYAALPPEQRAVVVGTATLPIPPGTPPGPYFLRIGVIDPEQATLRGEFQMPAQGDQVQVTPGQILVDAAQVAIPQRQVQVLAPEITLLGYAPPEQVISAVAPTWLTLYWQATAPAPDYEVRLRLLDSSGRAVSEWQGPPAQGSHPTSRWHLGEIVRDVWPLQVDPSVPVGTYDLEVSLVDPVKPQIQNRQSKIQNLEVWSDPISTATPTMQTEVGAQFGERLTLLGYDLFFDVAEGQPGSLTPHFYWQSRADFEDSYEMLLTLRNADTGEALQNWRLPLGSGEAKAFWKANEVVNTIYPLETGPLQEGRYDLDIALQNLAGGQPEPVRQGGGELTDFVRLENVQENLVVRMAAEQ